MKSMVELARADCQVMGSSQRQQLARFAVFDYGFATHDKIPL
jgi:hypothetical protein